MEYAPLICIIEDFQTVHKLSGIFIKTIGDWDKLK